MKISNKGYSSRGHGRPRNNSRVSGILYFAKQIFKSEIVPTLEMVSNVHGREPLVENDLRWKTTSR